MRLHLIPALAIAAVALSPAIASAAASFDQMPTKTFTVSELTGFTSPSGNIGCYISADHVRCDIRERIWTPPAKPASCNENTGWGQGLELNAGERAGFVCAGDTALAGGKPLAYGDTIQAGTISCDMTGSGVACYDASTGDGFELSREGYGLSLIHI